VKKFFILIIAVNFFSCDKSDSTNDLSIVGLSTQIISHDGIERQFLMYNPDSNNNESKKPLLINFHGFGGQVNQYFEWSNMRSLADSEDFILVYPQGTDLGGSSHWNAALNGGDNKSNTDDLGFVEALINKLSSENLIDNKRVYAIGYSNGGMMSYALACYKSNLIAAFGSVSGYMLQTECNPSHSIPLIKLHGTNDYYDGGGVYNSVESTLNYWVNFNNIDSNSILETYNDNGTEIEFYNYQNQTNQIAVHHYKILNGEHIWFDFNFKSSNSNKIIWDFFSKYDINGLRN
tara:strand:+ start:2599 stop:3471 length:873 start_codon:yes stop_codon:yes gene_type:complete